MNRIKRAAESLKRAACLFLALLMVWGLLPQPEARAAGDATIRLTDCDFTGLSYHSQAVGNASIHTMQFSYDGGATGFCYDHGKGMGRSLMGQSWSQKEEITDPTVKLILAYYYSHTLNKFTDKAIADGMNYPWDDGYTTFMNAWAQAVIWRYKLGKLDDPETACAEELMWMYNCMKRENITDIDEEITGDGITYREFAHDMFVRGVETWGECKVYLYTFSGKGSSAHSASNVQSIVIGSLETTTTESYNLTVKKVDAKTNIGLSGAEFYVEMQGGSGLHWTLTTGRDGTASLNDIGAGVYAITETKAPATKL